MPKSFKVAILTHCKICGTKLTKHRARIFCSKECRHKAEYQRWKTYRTEYNQKRIDNLHTKKEHDKKQCLECGLWYVQVGSHITQRHGMTARQYRELHDLPVKKGITAKEYQKRKGDECKRNGTVNNLKQGKRYWYKQDDPRAKLSYKKGDGWKGRAGKKGYKINDYY